MNLDDFRSHAHELVDWMADYLEHVRDYPVKAQVQPKEVARQLPGSAPDDGEPFGRIFSDFQSIILPGMTHWQHPSFHAYFPANSSPPSILAEMLMSTLGAQCMSWATSPAATELEETVMRWLQQMIGLPDEFVGVIQDTASTATLCSLLTAREKVSGFGVNRRGFESGDKYAIYCSTETHSSIEKAVKIAGFGAESLRKLAVDGRYAMRPDLLTRAVELDTAEGIRPLAVVATVGTTGSTAIDPVRAIGEICRSHNLWLHVDAAYAGTALLLEECRWMADGIELADSVVFNPHKWMFTNFDCSAYFVKDPAALVQTFEILPEYLKTSEGERVNNYRDWGIQLGRRFRALKLWFVIRTYGRHGLQAMVRRHISMAQSVARWIEDDPEFELLAPAPLNVLCFRYHPAGIDDPRRLDALNEHLLESINASGQAYLTHTRLSGAYAVRLVIAQTNVTEEDVRRTWQVVREAAAAAGGMQPR
ncbi:MAG: pyridoxal-dependent decarboxylase [candidate division Zixibacteria bacterium]|jgi:aromatic-L-amino-acid decarboxylase|nr:pyridoxal-dependent decarboxylase [candidate division Zixibacteria bacterium]